VGTRCKYVSSDPLTAVSQCGQGSESEAKARTRNWRWGKGKRKGELAAASSSFCREDLVVDDKMNELVWAGGGIGPHVSWVQVPEAQ
jgi:hypothetical protein